MIALRRLVLALLVLLSTRVFAADAPFDVVITNGHIVDGTGSPWYSGDIGIRRAAGGVSTYHPLFTNGATDVNSGPLLILLGLAYWNGRGGSGAPPGLRERATGARA